MQKDWPESHRIKGDPDPLVHIGENVEAVVRQGQRKLVDEKASLEICTQCQIWWSCQIPSLLWTG